MYVQGFGEGCCFGDVSFEAVSASFPINIVTPQIIESNHKPTGATSAGVNLTQCSPVNRSGLDCLI